MVFTKNSKPKLYSRLSVAQFIWEIGGFIADGCMLVIRFLLDFFIRLVLVTIFKKC